MKTKRKKLRTFLKGFSPEKARQPCVVERPEEVKLRLVRHSCCRCRLTPVPNDNTALSAQAKWSTRFGYGFPFDTMFCENTIWLLMYVWDFCYWTYTEAISFTGDCWPYFHGRCPPFISMMIYHIRPYTNQSHHVKEKDDSGSHISAQTMYRPNYVCSGKWMLTQWLEAVGTMTAVKRYIMSLHNKWQQRLALDLSIRYPVFNVWINFWIFYNFDMLYWPWMFIISISVLTIRQH